MASRNLIQRRASALVQAEKKPLPAQIVSSMQRMRSAVAFREDEDARLTGMTRSLDRRLLALNLQPVAPAGQFGYMKVA